jgi:hypothetical protein
MSPDFDLHGVFVSALLVWSVLALILTSVLRRVLDHVGFYRFVWHQPLFDLAVFVILLGGIVAAANAWSL